MESDQAYPSLEVAQAALGNPNTTIAQLVAICQAHPQLAAQAVWHPVADPVFVRWVALSPVPEIAQAAADRLAHGGVAPATPPPHQSVAPAQQTKPGPRKRGKAPLIVVIVMLLVVALGAGAYFGLPLLLGTESGSQQAPDIRELPTPQLITVEELYGRQMSPEDYYFRSYGRVGGGRILLQGIPRESSDYITEARTDYVSEDAQGEWDAEFVLGHARGLECLTEAPINDYFTAEEYCSGNVDDYLQSEGARSGFLAAVGGLGSDPTFAEDRPVVEPQVADTPYVIAVYDVANGRRLWTAEAGEFLDDAGPDTRPWISEWMVSGDSIILPIAEHPGEGAQVLVSIDVDSGDRLSTIEGRHPLGVGDNGEVVVAETGQLVALDAQDLTKSRWKSPEGKWGTVAIVGNCIGWGWSLGCPFVIDSRYVATQGGLLNLSDGSKVENSPQVASDSWITDIVGDGQYMVVVTPSEGTEYYEVNATIRGVSAKTGELTWTLHNVTEVSEVWGSSWHAMGGASPPIGKPMGN